MPRPGPRPYECVRRAWHSERHQPMRGSLIQELFRVANDLHSPATRKNKEWQQKLPFVVLKAEEIMYSKANSEGEYMDLTTLLDRAKDAIDTIIRRDESEETGDLLEPCIEAALNLGCVPRRASRSQRHNSPRCYLTPASQPAPPPPPSQPLEPHRNLSPPGSSPTGNLVSPYHHHQGPYSRHLLPVNPQFHTNAHPPPPPPGTKPHQQQQHCGFQFPSRYHTLRQMTHHPHSGGTAPMGLRFSGPSPTMIQEHANNNFRSPSGSGGFQYSSASLEHARLAQEKHQQQHQFLFSRTEPPSNPSCPYSSQGTAYPQYYIPSPNCPSTGLQQHAPTQNVGRCEYAAAASHEGLGPASRVARSGFLYNFLSSGGKEGGGGGRPQEEEEEPRYVGSMSENTHATQSFDLSLRLGRSSDQGSSGSWNQEVEDQGSSCSYGQGKLGDLNCPPISL